MELLLDRILNSFTNDLRSLYITESGAELIPKTKSKIITGKNQGKRILTLTQNMLQLNPTKF